MKLSRHFTDKEFLCKCCHTLPEGGMAKELITGLEALRAAVSAKLCTDTPLRVVSGYRCPTYNAKVSKAKKSQHKLGRAADLQIPSLKPRESVALLEELAHSVPEFETGGIGVYPTFLHVDVRGCYGQRRARWVGK